MTVSPLSPLVLAGRVVDLDAGVLRDASGVPLALRPQAWAVLALLARQVGKVVTKSQLLDSVWPGRVVTDGSLARAISDLRAAFGSDGHQVIKTAARRGYLLLAPQESAPGWALQRATPLPASRGPLFGRAAELAELCALMAGHRLVTIVGAGGVGKTAIAVAAARSLTSDLPSTSAWVDLAQLADPMLLVATVARSLGLPIAQGGDQQPGLLAALTPVTALLVLDNAEHLVAAVSRLTRAMLDAAPGLRVLVTSQAPLHIEAEHVFRLTSLDVPAPGASLAEACGCGAVALFADLARGRDRHFELTSANVGLVSELCRRLEGSPLAIRLAAARLPVLGLAGVVSRLDERLQLLAAGDLDVPQRQQTLLAALEWSHGLLQPREQVLFRRLGVFVGGFSLEMAVAIAAVESIDEWALIDQLNVLVERHLIDVDGAEPPRYRMLETQREYALRLLRSVGDMPIARHAHATAIDRVMRRAAEEIWVTTDAAWLPRWAPELDNVRAALDWSAANDVISFASLFGSVAGLFRLLDLAYELRQRAAAVSDQALAAITPKIGVRYWLTRTYLAAGVSSQAVHDAAIQAERAARSAADDLNLYLALCHKVASSLLTPNDVQRAMAEVLALEQPTWPTRARVRRPLAEFVVAILRRQWTQALRAAQQGFALACEGGNMLMQGTFANGILVALLGLGKVTEALARSQELRAAVLPGPSGSAIPFVGTCARCALSAGDLPAARRHFVQLFEMCRAVSWMHFDFFGNLYPRLPLAEGRLEDAAPLLGHAEVAGQRSWSVSRRSSTREDVRSVLSKALPQDLLSQLMTDGAGLDREAVCALVLKELEPALRRRTPPAPLTARQTEVLRLIGQGQTDKQVARTLGLSPRTIEMHVARAIDSLQCRNRAEAVRIATQRGLMG
jgi:predicted ATPase/DNA-binding winged helix-turn-helix (wHTH) protein/DNA-binding CsgD family transcriptional regulator